MTLSFLTIAPILISSGRFESLIFLFNNSDFSKIFASINSYSPSSNEYTVPIAITKSKKLSSFLEDYEKLDILVDYFDHFAMKLRKKNLNFFLKSVISP